LVSPGWPKSNYSFPGLLCKSLCFLTKCRKRWNILQSRQSNILIDHESKVTFEHQTQVNMHKFKPSLNYLWNLWACPYLPYSQCMNAHWCRTHGPSVSPLFSLWLPVVMPCPLVYSASTRAHSLVGFQKLVRIYLLRPNDNLPVGEKLPYIIHCRDGVFSKLAREKNSDLIKIYSTKPKTWTIQFRHRYWLLSCWIHDDG
jgi:hypothetical protein